MNSLRKFSVGLRWVVLIVAIGGAVYWVLQAEHMKPRPVQAVSVNVEPLPVPTPEVQAELEGVLTTLASMPESGAYITNLERRLFYEADEVGSTVYRPLDISLIFLSPKDKYAVLNGKPFKQGDILSDGRVIKAISASGVTLETDSGETSLAWVPPLRVELKKQAPETVTLGVNSKLDPAGQPEQLQSVDELTRLGVSPDEAIRVLEQLSTLQGASAQ